MYFLCDLLNLLRIISSSTLFVICVNMKLLVFSSLSTSVTTTLLMSKQELNKTLPIEATETEMKLICSVCAEEMKTLGSSGQLCKTVELPEALPHTPDCSTCGEIILGDTWELFVGNTTTPIFGLGRIKTRQLVVQSLQCSPKRSNGKLKSTM